MNNIERNDFLPINNWSVIHKPISEKGWDDWYWHNQAMNELNLLIIRNPGIEAADPRCVALASKMDPRYIKDQSTGKRYWNESTGCVRVKCLLLSLATPFIQPLWMIANVAYRILRIGRNCLDKTYRQNELRMDALRILATPFAYVGLELSALYGIFSPYNGRKLYGTIERFLYHTGKKPKNSLQAVLYGDAKMAPCFQANPVRHFFGGSPDKKNAL